MYAYILYLYMYTVYVYVYIYKYSYQSQTNKDFAHVCCLWTIFRSANLHEALCLQMVKLAIHCNLASEQCPSQGPEYPSCVS